MLQLPHLFSASPSLLIPTLPVPSLASQKPKALGERAFNTNPIAQTAICGTLTPTPPILCICQALLISHPAFFPTHPMPCAKYPTTQDGGGQPHSKFSKHAGYYLWISPVPCP